VNVQQGRLGSTDTTKNMAFYYNDTVATKVSEVDRSLHNGTQFVRLVLQRAQAATVRGALTGTPDVQVEIPTWFDGSFAPVGPIAPAELLVIGFGSPVKTTQIKIYTSQVNGLNETVGDWTVSLSLNNIDSEYSNTLFECTVDSVSVAFDDELSHAESNFYALIDITMPSSFPDGLPWYRIEHAAATAFAFVSEVEPNNNTSTTLPQIPTATVFDTDGNNASGFTFQKTNILDACYDNPNTRYYTVRFNTDNVGTTSLNLGDDFSDAEAGSAAGSNDFNPARWAESTANPQFLRSIGNENLTHNVALGKGQMETTYTLEDDFRAEVTVDPISMSTDKKWFVIRALDANNNTIMSEGVGRANDATVTGTWFSSYIGDLVDSAAAADFREGRPLWHNTQIGIDEFTVAFDGASWSVSGTLTGELADATTGAFYNEIVEPNTPIEFLIASTATPNPGDQFTFDLVTVSGFKPPTEGGNIGFERTGATWSGLQNTVQPAVAVVTDACNIELFGYTDGPINVEADDFTVSGTGVFPQIAVLTVEKTDDDGLVIDPPLIESFDVVGDPSLTYNDFLDGKVQIATTHSGTGGGFVYIKVNNVLYKYANDIALTVESGTNAVITPTTDQIPSQGTSSFNWTHASSIGGQPFLTYLEYDDALDIVHTKTISESTLLNTTSTKEVLLDISDFASTAYTVFFDQNDFDTLYYVDTGTNLRAFNLDDRISAFMAVNAQDTTLPAGTAQSTLVNADVINAWGEALDGKDVTFQVTGDGAVTPSTDTTISGGRATTQFTVGATVGVSTVTATVTEN
jgi:hypothetical protein